MEFSQNDNVWSSVSSLWIVVHNATNERLFIEKCLGSMLVFFKLMEFVKFGWKWNGVYAFPWFQDHNIEWLVQGEVPSILDLDYAQMFILDAKLKKSWLWAKNFLYENGNGAFLPKMDSSNG